MRKETKESISKAAVALAMVAPPWNIFWWIVGSAYYALSGASKRDHSRDAGLGLVLMAPVTLPTMPFYIYKEWRSKKKAEAQDAANAVAVQTMIGWLQARGITVLKSRENTILLECDVRPDQIAAYREVWKEILTHYGELIMANDPWYRFEPLEPINREWAESEGLTLWAEETFTPPCQVCHQPETRGFTIGHEKARAKQQVLDNFQPGQWGGLRIANGYTRDVEGFVCGDCTGKLSKFAQQQSQ